MKKFIFHITVSECTFAAIQDVDKVRTDNLRTSGFEFWTNLRKLIKFVRIFMKINKTQ